MGARAETEAEMAEVLRFALSQGVHPAMNRLDLDLRAAVDRVDSTRQLDLRVVNDVWVQEGRTARAEYLSVLEGHYGAGVRVLDFTGDPSGSRAVINAWVAARTDGRVPALFPAEAIHDSTRLVITNAVYFKARWRHEFDPGKTENGSFRNADGQAVSVPFMRGELEVRAASTPALAAVELPYAGEELALLLVMPSAAERDAFEAGLSATELERLEASLSEGKVWVLLPRFELELPLELDPVLQGLGLRRIYGKGAEADLSGLLEGPERLRLETVVHHAFIVVDEEGTEAAAAAGASARVISVPPTVRFDRPFVFFLRHRPSGAVLFMGRVAPLPSVGAR